MDASNHGLPVNDSAYVQPTVNASAHGCGPSWTERPHLGHVLEELIAAPAGHSPVIVILLRASNAQRAVASRRAAEELASAELDPAAVDAGSGLGDDVPVRLLVEVLGPAATGSVREMRPRSTRGERKTPRGRMQGRLTLPPCARFPGLGCAGRPRAPGPWCRCPRRAARQRRSPRCRHWRGVSTNRTSAASHSNVM